MKRNPPIKKKRGLMRKPGSSVLDKRMVIPGKEIFPQLVSGNTPLKEGVYLVYYKYDPPEAWSTTKQVAGATVASYEKGGWGLNHTVYAYMGPIPSLALPSLLEYKPPYLVNQIFYVATLEEAAKELYTAGPFPQYTRAFLYPGHEGLFIFCKDSENVHPYPISKYSIKLNNYGNFIELSEKAITKYMKMLNHLRG